MGKLQDLSGETFGRLLVSNRDNTKPSGNGKPAHWISTCECGNIVSVRSDSLRSGNTQSCGCLQKEASVNNCTTHGQSDSRMYRIWDSMRSRCNNKSHFAYDHYGGRGIFVCEEWKSSFTAFMADMLDGYSDELTLDRKDVNAGYCKSNCKWSTNTEQAFNKRLQKSNTSGVCGVHFSTKRKRWVAEIDKEGKTHYLGSFVNYEEAVRARKAAELKYYGFIKQE